MTNPGTGDPALADYFPAWLKNLADDVTLEGSMMDGFVQGSDTVRSVIVAIRELYDYQSFHSVGPYGENGWIEDYTARYVGSRSATSPWSRATPPGRHSTPWAITALVDASSHSATRLP